jgi:hypothetical protein
MTYNNATGEMIIYANGVPYKGSGNWASITVPSNVRPISWSSANTTFFKDPDGAFPNDYLRGNVFRMAIYPGTVFTASEVTYLKQSSAVKYGIVFG